MSYLKTRSLSVPITAGGIELSPKRSRNHITIQNSSAANFVELFFGDVTVTLGQGIILNPLDVYVIDSVNNQQIFTIADTAPVILRINEG